MGSPGCFGSIVALNLALGAAWAAAARSCKVLTQEWLWLTCSSFADRRYLATVAVTLCCL